jgi:hypothetical protein
MFQHKERILRRRVVAAFGAASAQTVLLDSIHCNKEEQASSSDCCACVAVRSAERLFTVKALGSSGPSLSQVSAELSLRGWIDLSNFQFVRSARVCRGGQGSPCYCTIPSDLWDVAEEQIASSPSLVQDQCSLPLNSDDLPKHTYSIDCQRLVMVSFRADNNLFAFRKSQLAHRYPRLSWR